MSRILWKKVCVFLIFLSVSFNITYWAMAKYDVYSDLSAVGDAKHYVEMSQGNYKDVPKRYLNRFLMPSIVSFLNRGLKVEKILSRYYEDVGSKMMQLSFGLVNIICLSVTAFIFFLYCGHLKFAFWESFSAALLFLTSFFVVTYYTVPMVDSMAVLCMILCFYAILRKNLLMLSMSFLVGVFVKEALFIIPLVVMVSERRFFSKMLLACLPGTIAYILFVKFSGPTSGAYLFCTLGNMAKLKNSLASGIREFTLYSIIEHVQTFMFLWILFIYALWKKLKPDMLRRQAWLLLLPFIVPFLVNSAAVGRVAFYLFPIVIPLTISALKNIIGEDSEKSFV